jgi:hypothetical protein
MSERDVPARWRRGFLGAVVCGLMFVLSAGGQSSSSAAGPSAATPKTGTLVDARSDKKVLQTGRWMVVRQFTVNFAVKCSNQTYCGEVTTTVVNEVDDLMASKGQPVELLESGKDIDVTLHSGRRIKARQVAANKCAQN